MIVITIARKPVPESVARNIIKHGTGGMNINAGRIRFSSPDDRWVPSSTAKAIYGAYMDGAGEAFRGPHHKPTKMDTKAHDGGRWPANIILEHKIGCRCVGSQQVEGYVINRWEDGSKPFGGGAGHPYSTEITSTDNVAVWDCEPGCPVASLDANAGLRWNGGNTGQAKAAGSTSWFTGKGLPPNGEVTPHSWGLASRYFKQIGGK